MSKDFRDMICKRTEEIVSFQLPRMNCTEKYLQEFFLECLG